MLNVAGRARATDGEAHVTLDGHLTGRLVIDAASVNTKNSKRDTHLRTADFFEVDTYPSIIFDATGGRQTSPGRFEVDGTLTVHGQPRPFTVPAEVSMSDGSATVVAEVDIDRRAWGLTWAKMGADVKNRVVVRAHFDRA